MDSDECDGVTAGGTDGVQFLIVCTAGYGQAWFRQDTAWPFFTNSAQVAKEHVIYAFGCPSG